MTVSHTPYASIIGGEPVLLTVWNTPPAPRVPGSFRPRVAVCFMHNGDCHPQAARGFYRARFEQGDVDVVAEMEIVSSFVPQGYNIALHHALELRDQGVATHFAMLHADISPEPRWIDGLWRDMQLSQADAIAAVAPIKEPQYQRTTTVIGDPGNPWIPKRTVNMTDRQAMSLPDVFDITHVGDPSIEFLQINTGCMLVDLRRDWWDVPRVGASGDFFAFELMQQVVRINKDAAFYAALWAQHEATVRAHLARGDSAAAEECQKNAPPRDYGEEIDRWAAHVRHLEATGDLDRAEAIRQRKPLPFVRQTQSRSEDWEMSRHIWQHGGKCAATFAVGLDHFGSFAWSNQARVLVKGA